VFQSGWWLTPYYVGVDPAGRTPGTSIQAADRIGDGNVGIRAPRTGLPFFDVGAFVCPGGSTIKGQANLLSAGCPLSTPANVGRSGNSGQRMILGPGINVWNWSIMKQFNLSREDTNIVLAAQIANPFNHANWTPTPSMNLSSPASVGIINATRNEFIQPWSYGFRKITLNLRVNF
jgi:hypothetical protein